MKTIILSCAHGIEVPGKRSPDQKHREYRWSRDVQYRIADGLKAHGVTTVLIPERGIDSEPGLWNRVKIENTYKNAFVFSLHNNAAGNGAVWMSARGVEIWTSKGQTKSDEYATQIYTRLQNAFNGEIKHWRMDKYSDGDVDKEANFTELMSVHPAVLLEWLFQDNKEDVALLQDENITTLFVNTMVQILLEISNS